MELELELGKARSSVDMVYWSGGWCRWAWWCCGEGSGREKSNDEAKEEEEAGAVLSGGGGEGGMLNTFCTCSVSQSVTVS